MTAILVAAIAALLFMAERAQGTSPFPAPGCSASPPTTFTQTTAQTISDNTITSAIAASGLSGTIHDVDVNTSITHARSQDLLIALTAPSGKVVTLSTGNGEDNTPTPGDPGVDVFNGTRWDDDADPGSNVPYGSPPPNIATDNRYDTGVAESTLTPEEPLGALIGDNPNGTWTLTIIDSVLTNTGSLNQWSVTIVTTQPPAQTTTTSTTGGGVPLPVPDAVTNPTPPPPTIVTPVTATATVAGAGSYLSDLNVTTNLPHMHSNDIDMTLTSPMGTVVTLTTDNAGNDADEFAPTLWDDGVDPGSPIPYATNPSIVTDHSYTGLPPSSPLTPEEPLAAFIGENPNGVWTLTIVDDTANLLTGTLQSWTLHATTQACAAVPPPPPPTADLRASVTDTPDPVRAGGALAYDVTVANLGPAAATNVSFNTTLPATVRFAGVSPSSGGSCTTPAVGATGALSCSWAGSTASGASRTANIIVSPWKTGALGTTFTATSATSDPTAANNSATATTSVIASAKRASNGARCTIVGDSRRNVLAGTAGRDVVCGLGGNDHLRGLGSNDTVDGGAGDDIVVGGAGADQVYGGSGRDVVAGGDGNDRALGGSGRDRLAGGNGNDLLIGGLALDILNGGRGFDRGVRGGDILIGIERTL